MKTAKIATKAKLKQTRRKAEHRNPRTCYAMSKDKQHVYRFVNHAQRLDFMLRDKLVPLDALAYRAITNADVTGKLVQHDMRGVAFTPAIPNVAANENQAIPTSTEDVKGLLESFKHGVASILNEFSQKLEQFTPIQTEGGTVERISPSH